MPKKALNTRQTPKPQRGYNTNLASEFYVLSVLYRLGLEANLTLGNKKSVDIVVACAPGVAFTIEVKSVAGKNDWLVGSLAKRDHHYVVLVSYEGKFDDLNALPMVWVYPSHAVMPLVKTSKTGSAHYISRREVHDTGSRYLHGWQQLRSTSV